MALVELFERAKGPVKAADGSRYVKVFVTIPALLETDAPDVGDLMSGESGVMGARVTRTDPQLDARNARTLLVVAYESLTAFTGGDATELARSRYRDESVPEDVYVRRWAWNGTDAMPVAKGDAYAGTSGTLAPTCSKIVTQREWNAGRHLVTAYYPDPQAR